MHTPNLLTFDLEDWFHILGLRNAQSTTSHWESIPSRFEPNVDRILQLLADSRVRATFFVLGCIADRYPQVVRTVANLGHEIACHGYGHDLIYDLTPDQFRQDIRRARTVLEDTTGSPVRGYRGPGFSITRENVWAFDVIAEEGFSYDATIFPGTHGHGGISDMPRTPFTLLTAGGNLIHEFPATLVWVGKYKLAFSGGGYFRILPFVAITRLIRLCNRKSIPVMVYMHPRDIDPQTPRLPMPLSRRFKSYVNLSGSYEKLKKTLADHRFVCIKDWLEKAKSSLPVVALSNHPGNMEPKPRNVA